MPSVLTTSTLIDHIDIYDFPTTPPRARGAQQGFWRTLVQRVARPRVRETSHRQHPYVVSRQLETPVELLARQYPARYLRACLGV